MLFGKLLPRDGDFFQMFNQHAAYIVAAAHSFSKMVEHYADLELREKHNREVDEAERAADRVTHQVNKVLHKTFITPIDREQIHTLINTMDDVADLLQDAAETMALYDVHHMTEEIVRLTDLSVRCCERVKHAVSLLANVAKLFRNEQDVREIIKLKAVYELLETVTDKCEDVANIVEGIVLENS
jgi:predicted phosphate transport protein (TIGR00153 family)